MSSTRTRVLGGLVALGFCAGGAFAADGWAHYGASLAGDRYHAPSEITVESVRGLVSAWTYRTGDTADGRDFDGNPSRFVATPILVGNRLVVSTPFNRVVALDPATGSELWTFDPGVDFSRPYSEMFTSRGVAAWRGPAGDGPCRERVFLGTLDARLIALDADTGLPCADFGKRGSVDLSSGIRLYYKWDYSLTSPTTVVGDLVVVGSSIGDNGRAELQPGVVRAYDVRTGAQVWAFDPIPRSPDHPGIATWAKGERTRTGAANVWSVISADAERDMVFLPTTSPSPDFYGGERLGDNAFANSVVALRASTGEFLWGHQTVRHDLWDLDIASQPLLFSHTDAAGNSRPAVAQATKMGFVFVLDRETGESLHPVEERAVPASDIPGERAAPTQPFAKLRLIATDARPLPRWSVSDEHRAGCDALLAGVRYEGIFTPPSIEGSLLFPGNDGGANWGSMAYDPGARIGYVAVNRIPTIVKLIPRKEFRAARRGRTLNGNPAEFAEQGGTPYGMARTELLFDDFPCLEGPWSTLAALDLDRGEVLWDRPVGEIGWRDLGPVAGNWGHFIRGGPMVTEGGVVFLATPYDHTLRAHDGATGEVLWSTVLPAGAHATPMGYRHAGTDYVVVTAGGRLTGGGRRGDHVLAFRLQSGKDAAP
ncbi:MAG: pyrroloquinoline quinone-dependent dehydrogenase [Gammaproteobacteria bacterium]|nr:pyrroloquinoline quinone-dependent dehydrogenase [Gammaproteobacteria bacterium]